MIRSDWHIHSQYSYDAALRLDTIAQAAIDQGLTQVGITDHLNFNDESFLGNLRDSAAGVKAAREKYPFMVLGVELTPLEKPEYDYIAKTGTREGYVPPASGTAILYPCPKARCGSKIEYFFGSIPLKKVVLPCFLMGKGGCISNLNMIVL